MTLDALSLWFSKTHWKHTWRKSIGAFLAALGVMSVVVRFAFQYFPERAEALFGSIWSVALPAVLWSMRESWPVRRVEHRLNFSDVRMEIKIGDVFDVPGAVVVSTNTTFDTSVSTGIIAPDSLQGQFLARYYDTEAHLDRDLETSLEGAEFLASEGDRRGKTRKYANGTVVGLQPRGKVAYFVAIADMNAHGVASSSLEQVLEGLGSLWNYIAERGGMEPLAVPVLGTGRGRIAVPRRQEMIEEIVESFIAACSEAKFCDKLTIVISEKDYRDNEMDLTTLGRYLEHRCKYTKLREAVGGVAGEGVP